MEMNRREFVTISVAAIAAAAACSACGSAEALGAEAPAGTEATTPVDVGPLASFKADGINDKFAASQRFLLITADGKLYASTASCTHKACKTPLKIKDGAIACACHGSKFAVSGIVTKGPAKNSLYRYAISVNDKGNVIVDKTKQFAEKDWEAAGSFVEIKKA